MAKMKKSIKAIIISICAAIVLAGSIVGVVLATTNKGKGGSGSPAVGGGNTPVSPGGTNPPAVVYELTDSQKELVNLINSSTPKAEIAGEFNYDEFFYEDRSQIDLTKVKKVKNGYLIYDNSPVVEKTALIRIEETDKVYYKDVFEILNLSGNIVYKEFLNFVGDFLAVKYVIDEGSKLNIILDVYDFSDPKAPVLEKSMMVENVENFATSESSVTLCEDFYYFIAHPNNSNYKVEVYSYESDEPLVSKSATYSAVSIINDFDNLMYFNNNNLFTFVYFDGEEFNVFEKDLTNAVGRKVCNDLVVVEYTTDNVNYTYQILDLETQELTDFELKDGFKKAKFTDFESTYLKVYQEKDENTKLFTYYDYDFNKIIEYETDTEVGDILYSEGGKLLTYSGVIGVEKTITANYLTRFASDAFEYRIASLENVNSNGGVFVVSNEDSSQTFMKMNGEIVFEETFSEICSYGNGYYVAYNPGQYYLIDVKSGEILEIETENFYNENYFIMNNGGYFIVENPDEVTYSVFDYSGKLLSGIVSNVDYKKFQNQTALILNQSDGTILSFVVDRDIPIEDVDLNSVKVSSKDDFDYTQTYELYSDEYMTVELYFTCPDSTPDYSRWYYNSDSTNYADYHANVWLKQSNYTAAVKILLVFGYYVKEGRICLTPRGDGNLDFNFNHTGAISTLSSGEGSARVGDYTITPTRSWQTWEGFGGYLLEYHIQLQTDDERTINKFIEGYPRIRPEVHANPGISRIPAVVEYNYNSGSAGTYAPTTVYFGSTTTISDPNRTGYTFTGWIITPPEVGYTKQRDEGTCPLYTSSGTSYTFYPQLGCKRGSLTSSPTTWNITYTFSANWSENSYNISYVLDGGEHGTNHPTSAKYTTTITVSNPTRVGHTFTGWNIYLDGDPNDTLIKSAQMGTSYSKLTSANGANVIFTATWRKNNYTIKFTDLVSGSTLSITQNAGATETGEWEDGKRETYTVTANSSGVATTDMKFGYAGGANDTGISNPLKTGYTFMGWEITGMCSNCTHWWGSLNYTGESSAENTKATAGYLNLTCTDGGEVTFKAHWQANSYSISYELNGGSISSAGPVSATFDDTPFNVVNPTRLGYIFDGWDISGCTSGVNHYHGTSTSLGNSDKFTGTTSDNDKNTYFKNLSTGDTVTFSAQWTAITYNLNYNLASGTHGSTHPSTATYDQEFSLSNPTRTGYIFDGWNVTDMSNTTTHYLGTGVEVNATTTSYNGVKATSGFKNLHSSSGATVNFTATWTPITYNITYDYKSGKLPTDKNNPTSKNYDEEFTVNAPVRHGYNFAGWTIGNSSAYTSTSTTANYPNSRTDNFENMTTTNGETITFTANWTAVTYRVTFYHDSSNHDDGTATYSYDATPFTKEHPTKMGYTFTSWSIAYCTNCNNTLWPDCNHKIGSQTSEGIEFLNVTATSFQNLACIQGTDVTFTANWNVNSYNVQISGAYGANLEMSSVPFDSWFYVDAPTDHPVGYHFTGWSVTSMIDKDANTNETVTHYHDTEKTSGTHESATGTTLTIANTASRYYFKNLHSTNGATVTITPTWEANNYTVTFDLNNPNWVTSDISSQATIDATYDVAFTVANPTKAGYTFAGWELNDLSDNCDHYHGTTNATSTKFSSNGGKYDAGATLVKDTWFKNFRSDTGAALMKAIWQVNSYTITYHVLPKTFDATAFAASEIHTKINVVNKLTVTITQEVTYDRLYKALEPHTPTEINFEMPVGLRFVLWAIPSNGVTVTSTTSVGKYEPAGSETVVSALGDSIGAGEQRVYGPGELAANYTDWQYYSKDMHFYAVYELAGINLRYYIPTTAAGSNFLQNYKNVDHQDLQSLNLSHLNVKVKYTDIITFADNVNIPNYENFMGWMISATYDSDGQLTKDSLSRYTYQSTTYAAYRGFSACWGFTNVDAYSYEDPTYFLYAVYDDEYSGDYGSLSFTYDNASQTYSVTGRGNDSIPSDGHIKIPSHFDNGSTGFKPVAIVGASAFRYFSNLKSLYMPDTITLIYDYAFQDTGLTQTHLPSKLEILCGRTYSGTAITSFTAPETLKEIRAGNAFDSCTSLKTVVLNEGLTFIGGATFQGCSALETINIPSTVTFIGNLVFNGCSKITSINIPVGVSTLGNNVFNNCSSLASVTFDPNSSLMSIDTYCFANCSALTSISIPNSVTSIGMGTFYNCTNLASITMPDKLSTLEVDLFANCIKLTSIVIPQGVTEIKNFAFYNCLVLSEVKLYEGITTLGTYVFANCAALTNIDIPDSVTSIGEKVFSATGNLATMEVPFIGASISSPNVLGYFFGTTDATQHAGYVTESLTTIKVTKATDIAANCFANIASLKSLTLPNTVTSIGQNILNGCSALEYLSVPYIGTSQSDTTNNFLGYWLGQTDKTVSLETIVPALKTVHITNATNVGDYALYYIKTITTLTLNENITSIGNGAFSHLENLPFVDIPSTVTSIGNFAFSYCFKLTNVGLNEGLTTLGAEVFDNCRWLNNVTIPSTVQAINKAAFWRCSSLSNLTILDGVTLIGEKAFIYCSALTTLTMPKTLTSIGLNAFQECTGLVTVVLNEGLTSIGEYAFLDCTALKNINLPSTLTFMGHSAIRRTAIESITVPASLTSSGISILAENRSLKSVYLTEGLTFIPEEMFAYCSALETIYIPSTVTTIGVETFYDCTSLKHIEVAGNVSIIPTSFAHGCTALKEVLFKGHPTEIQNNAFYACSSLDYVYYGGTVDEYNAMSILPVGNEDFKTATTYHNYDHMTFTYTNNSYSIMGNGTVTGALEIPATYDDGIHGRYVVDKIEESAFASQTGITSVVINEGMVTIEDSAFYNCNTMTSFTFSSTVTHLGDNMLANANMLQSLHIPAGVTEIPNAFLENADQFRTLTFEDINSVKKIGNNAFHTCMYFSSIQMPQKLEYIGIRAFYKTGFTGEIVLPEGLEFMGHEAFAYSTLRKVVLPSTLGTVEGEVFSACPNLSNIFIPKGVHTIVADQLGNNWITSTGPNNYVMIFTEYETPQAGWGKYWDYVRADTGIKAWVFYGYKKAPSIVINVCEESGRVSYGMKQDEDGNIVSDGRGAPDAAFRVDMHLLALNDYVNIRFDWQVISDSSWGFYKYAANSWSWAEIKNNNGKLMQSSEQFSLLLAPGEQFEIYGTSGDIVLSNFGFDAIESETTEYGFNNVTENYDIVNSTYRLISSNAGVNNSKSVFKIYASSPLEISFMYSVLSEYQCDVFRILHNGSSVLDVSGTIYSELDVGNFSTYLTQGDTLELVYSKDGSDEYGDDQVIIYNLQIKQQALLVNEKFYNYSPNVQLDDNFLSKDYTSIHFKDDGSYDYAYIGKIIEANACGTNMFEWIFQIRINYTDSTTSGNGIRFLFYTGSAAKNKNVGSHTDAFIIPAEVGVYDFSFRADTSEQFYAFYIDCGHNYDTGQELYFDIACIYQPYAVDGFNDWSYLDNERGGAYNFSYVENNDYEHGHLHQTQFMNISFINFNASQVAYLSSDPVATASSDYCSLIHVFYSIDYEIDPVSSYVLIYDVDSNTIVDYMYLSCYPGIHVASLIVPDTFGDGVNLYLGIAINTTEMRRISFGGISSCIYTSASRYKTIVENYGATGFSGMVLDVLSNGSVVSGAVDSTIDVYNNSNEAVEDDRNLYINNVNSIRFVINAGASVGPLVQTLFQFEKGGSLNTKWDRGQVTKTFDVIKNNAVVVYRYTNYYNNNGNDIVLTLSLDGNTVISKLLSKTLGTHYIYFICNNLGTYSLNINFNSFTIAPPEYYHMSIGCVYEYGTKSTKAYLSDFRNLWTETPKADYDTILENNNYIRPDNSGYITTWRYDTFEKLESVYTIKAPYDMLLSFDYDITCDAGDYVRFYKNSTKVFEYGKIEPKIGKYSIMLKKGETFKISYKKDTSGTKGYDGYRISNLTVKKVYQFERVYISGVGWVYQSTNIGEDSSESILTLNQLTSSVVMFDYEISSEEGADRIEVYINGEFRFSSYGTTSGRFAEGFAANSYIEIKYIKDASINEGDDKCIIKNLTTVI